KRLIDLDALLGHLILALREDVVEFAHRIGGYW
ncbi:MAG: hypothetical protein ACI80K_001607, partial [Paracoccaceae bacterium]